MPSFGSTTTWTFTNLQFEIANTAKNTFDSSTFTYTSYVNLQRDYPTLAPSNQPININTSCVNNVNLIFRFTDGSNAIILYNGTKCPAANINLNIWRFRIGILTYINTSNLITWSLIKS